MQTPRPVELPSLQMRLPLAYEGPNAVVNLTLSGLSALAEVVGAGATDFERELDRCDVSHTRDAAGIYHLHLRQLGRLAALAPGIELRTDGTLHAVLTLLTAPPADDAPAVVDRSGTGDLLLSWDDADGTHCHAEIPAVDAGTLLATGVSFTATSAAWEVLAGAGVLPGLIATARSTIEGYIEINAPVPQLLEGAPLPGMFRLDTTRFGLSRHYAPLVDTVPGFRWDGPRPVADHVPDVVVPATLDLSDHHRADLARLVHRLTVDEAAVLWWDAGLGRRVMALAALEVLDAWPLTIVCNPAQVWAWQRHLELIGRSGSVVHDRADARILTYDELAAGARIDNPAALILDDLPNVAAEQPVVLGAIGRLANLAGTYRIAVTSSWPAEPDEACALMSLLRPSEFTAMTPVAHRYPAPAAQRAAEHLDAYVHRRRGDDPDTATTRQFRHTSVRVLRPNDAQLRAIGESSWTVNDDPAAAVAEQLELVSAGTRHAISPKIAAATAMVEAAVDAGRRVVVVCRHGRTASLLRATQRHLGTRVVDTTDGAPNGPVVLQSTGALPDLRWADEVIVVDWPFATAALDAAVGAATDGQGPRQITVLHLAGTIDDRVALLAARRREVGGVIDQQAAPSRDELAYLLGIPVNAVLTAATPATEGQDDGDDAPLRLRPSVMRPPRF